MEVVRASRSPRYGTISNRLLISQILIAWQQALTAPFVIRFRALSEHGLMPANLLKSMDALPNYSKWSKAVCAEDAVTYVFDAPSIAKGTAERIAKLKANAN